MQSKLVWENAGERTFILVLDAGEEAFAAIDDFAARSSLAGASLTALGASSARRSAGSISPEDL